MSWREEYLFPSCGLLRRSSRKLNPEEAQKLAPALSSTADSMNLVQIGILFLCSVNCDSHVIWGMIKGKGGNSERRRGETGHELGKSYW